MNYDKRRSEEWNFKVRLRHSRYCGYLYGIEVAKKRMEEKIREMERKQEARIQEAIHWHDFKPGEMK